MLKQIFDAQYSASAFYRTDVDNNETLPMKEEISRMAIHIQTLFLLAHVVWIYLIYSVIAAVATFAAAFTTMAVTFISDAMLYTSNFVESIDISKLVMIHEIPKNRFNI